MGQFLFVAVYFSMLMHNRIHVQAVFKIFFYKGEISDSRWCFCCKSKDNQGREMLLKKKFLGSQTVKMDTPRAPSGQELWHLEKAVFLGHYRGPCALTSDPQGVRAKAAAVCSCRATRSPAKNARHCKFTGPANIVPRQKLIGLTGRAVDGK